MSAFSMDALAMALEVYFMRAGTFFKEKVFMNIFLSRFDPQKALVLSLISKSCRFYLLIGGSGLIFHAKLMKILYSIFMELKDSIRVRKYFAFQTLGLFEFYTGIHRSLLNMVKVKECTRNVVLTISPKHTLRI